jgi:hypothetical protein
MIGTKEPVDFFGAEVRFLDTQEGGRKGPLWPHAGGGFAGFRPNLRVIGNDVFHGAAFSAGPVQINPGDLAVVELIFWCCDGKHPEFDIGNRFELFEGTHKVAEGKFLTKGKKQYAVPGLSKAKS